MGSCACSLPGNSCCAEAVEGFGMSFSSCQTYWPSELFSHDSEGEFGDFPYLPGWSLWGAGWEEKVMAFGGCWMLSSSQPSSCSSICADRAPGRACTASGRQVKGTAGWGRNQSWEHVSMAGVNACACQEPKSRLCWSLVRSRGSVGGSSGDETRREQDGEGHTPSLV